MKVFKHFNDIPFSDKEKHLKGLEREIHAVGECRILKAPKFFHLIKPRYRLLSKVYYFALKNKGRVSMPHEMLTHSCGNSRCVSDKHLKIGTRNGTKKEKRFVELDKILSKKWIT